MFRVEAVAEVMNRLTVQPGGVVCPRLGEAEEEIFRLQQENKYPFARVSFPFSRPLEIVVKSEMVGAAKVRSGNKEAVVEFGRNYNWQKGKMVVEPEDLPYLCLGLKSPVTASDYVAMDACWIRPFHPERSIAWFYFKLDKPFLVSQPASLIADVVRQINNALDDLFGSLVNAA